MIRIPSIQTMAHAAALLLLPATTALATVTLVGADATTGANWRTAAALDGDGQYGTSGYVIFGLNAADAVYTQPYDVSAANIANAYNLPSGVSLTTLDANIGMWSGNGNFGQIQHPEDGDALTSAPVLANSNGPKDWTITRSGSTAYRLTLLTASGDNEGTAYTISVNDGSGAVSSIYDFPGPGVGAVNGVAYHVFDVSAGTSDILVNVLSGGNNRQLTGIAFDPVPEPSSALLVGLAALGCLRRRRA